MSNINLTTLFNTLGVVGGNTASTNQYEFFNGVEWSDGTFTYNQYEFFKKAAGSRYDFFKDYESERAFYKAIDDERIYDFYTFYKYAGEYLSSALFIDLFGAPDVAFSVRKLNSAYTGAALRVRKPGDEKDIGFVGNDLDTADILDFVGSQNLFPDSEDASDFSNQVAVTITTNTLDTTDPLGGNTADKVVSTGTWLLRDNLTNVVSGRTYTISVWVKAVSGSATFRFIVGNALTSNITTTDEWVRYSATIVSTGTATGVIRDSSSNPIEAYFWGFQISEGSELQDYIKTDGAVNLGTGYVSKWYDQSGNGNDVTIINTTEQPLIMENGLLKVDANGITAPYLDGDNDQFENILNIKSKENLFIITTTSKADWGSTYSTGAIIGAANNQFLRFNGDLTRLEARMRNTNYDGSFDSVVTSTLTPPSAGDNKTRIIGFYNYNKADFVAGNASGNDYEFAVFEYDTLGITQSTTNILDSASINNGIDIGTRNPSAAADWFKGFIHEVIIYTGESELYRSDFTVDTDGWLFSNGAISATSSALRFVPDTSALQHFTRVLPGFEDDKTYKVVGEVYIPSSVTTFTKVRIWTAFSAHGYIDIDTKDAWTKFNITIKPSAGGSLRVQPIPDVGIGFTGNDSDYIEIRGVIIDEILDDMKDKVNNLSDINANINDYFGGYGSLLLDVVPDAAAAYSLRKLRGAYIGSAVRVRRSSDSTEQDIGFTTEGELDTTSLLSFVGGENLLLQSNDFDTSPWSAPSVILTGGQSGYDGSSDAWLVTKTSSGPQSVFQYLTKLGIYTMSVYAKAGTVNWMRITHGGKTAYFDLANGVVGSTSNGIAQTITSVGGGWYRCTLTADRLVAGQTPIYPYTAEGNASGSSDSIYIQDAQMEAGSVATTYNPTTTGIGGDGLVSAWYDQSGNSNDAEQLSAASAQPKIVSSGAVITEGTSAKPAIDFDGVDDELENLSVSIDSTSYSAYMVTNTTGNSARTLLRNRQLGSYGTEEGAAFFELSNSDTLSNTFFDDGNGNAIGIANGASVSDGQHLLSTEFTTLSAALYVDGISTGTHDTIETGSTPLASVSLPYINIGGGRFSREWSSTVQEIIIYSSDQSSNRTAIETNINTFYSIYL